MNFKKIYRVLLFLLLLGIITGMPITADAAINKQKATVLVSEKLNLKITGTKAKTKWSTSNKKIAKVSQAGVVTGVKPGKANITAKIKNKKYTCRVTVKIGINKTELSLYPGEASAVKLCGTAIRAVETSNRSVATVTKKGKIKAAAAGKAKITLTGANGKKYTCSVTVKNNNADVQPTGIVIDEKLSIDVNQTVKISARIIPDNAADQTITWSSNNEKIAVVNDGNVTGKRAGTAVITARTCNGKTAQCTVTVGIQEARTFDDFAKAAADLIKNSPAPAGSGIEEEDEFFARRLIVQCKNSDISFDTYNPRVIIKGVDNLYVLQFSTSDEARKAFGEIANLPNVEYVEPDSYMEASADEEISSESLSWGTSAIGADKYARYVSSATQNQLKAAVVDSGVSNHPFLSGRITTDGYDFVDNDSAPTDREGHGTHVAGTIVDCTPGLNVKIMPVRVLNEDGKGSFLNVANGVRYAADHGAKVINMSLGGPHSETLDNSISYAVKKGVVVVVAAGNEYGNTEKYCPSHLPEAIVVGAVDSNNKRAAFSNVGKTLDVVAPGVDIVSCRLGGGYKSLQGTSMATPHVTAVAAMFRLVHPSHTPAQIEKLIKNNTKDLGSSGWDKYYGYGIPDLSKLAVVEVKSVTLNTNDISIDTGETYKLVATVTPDNATDKTITWRSSNEAVASVKNGTVTGISAGKTVITAEASNGKFASCTVLVPPNQVPATSIRMGKPKIGLIPGASTGLGVIVEPSDAAVIYESSDSNVVDVSQNGSIRGVSVGSATITARTSNGLSASCQCIVLQTETDRTNYTCAQGSTLQIHARVTMDHPLRQRDRQYVLYLAYADGWRWEEIGSYNIDGENFMEKRWDGPAEITSCTINGSTADLTIAFDTSGLPQKNIRFTLSVFPYDNFATGGSLWDHLFYVNIT